MILSPVTNKPNVIFEQKISTLEIIDRYRSAFSIDVSQYFTDLDFIEIYKCLDTGYRFYYPFNVDGDGRFYEHFQKYEWYYTDWKWEHETVKQLVSQTNKVLEIGCGPGSFLSKLSILGIDCVGLELNKDAVKACRKKGLSVFNRSIQDHIQENTNMYDLVCSFQVMEHISAIQEVIEASISCLKKGGKLCISVPNNDSYLGLYNEILNMPPHHMGLWNKSSLLQLPNVFPIELDNIYFEPLQPHQTPLFNSLLYESRYNKYQDRLKKYWLAGRIVNRVETYFEKILYPTLRNFTIVAVYHKI